MVTDSIEMLSKAGYDDSYIAQFTDDAVRLLNDYAKLIGEGTEIIYSLKRRLTRIDLKVLIPGAQFDPFESGSGAKNAGWRA